MSPKDNKTLQVSAIKNGTVIDHIPSNCLFKVISMLHLDGLQNQMTFGTNLESSKLASKAIIKISDRFFADSDINKIALIAPQVKLSIIENPRSLFAVRIGNCARKLSGVRMLKNESFFARYSTYDLLDKTNSGHVKRWSIFFGLFYEH